MSKKRGDTMNRDGVLTIELKLDLDWALVEWYTDALLSDENMDIAAFTREEIAHAWTAAVQKKMELWAEDADSFLDRNGAEERFWQVLLAE